MNIYYSLLNYFQSSWVKLIIMSEDKRSENLQGLNLFFKKFDLFSHTLPSFNIHGDHKVRTSLGGMLSLMTIFTTILFSLLKLQHLLEKKNPSIQIFD